MRLSANVIIHQICCGQGRALSLRYYIEFNLTTTKSYYKHADFLGDSKPPPYAAGRKFTLTDSRKAEKQH